MKRCMYCGHENEDALVTCAVCGNKLGDPVPTQDVVITMPSGAGQENLDSGSPESGDGSVTDQGAGTADAASAAGSSPAELSAEGQSAAASVPSQMAGADGMVSGVSDMPSGTEQAEGFSGAAGMAAASIAGAAGGLLDAAGGNVDGSGQPSDTAASGSIPDRMSAEEEAMVTQEPAFAGQIPVNKQFGETSPAGQFTGQQQVYQPDRTPGYGEDWRQDVGRGQTYGARTQYEARREGKRAQGSSREGVTGGSYNGNGIYGASSRDQYGSAGYGYRQPQGPDAQSQGGRRDYGRRESAGGSKMFMVRARKRVKSIGFWLMALTFTAMLGLNVYNIYSGNALRNIMDSDVMLANILSRTGTNFFTQMLTELASQLVKMVVNVQNIIAQLGKPVELCIAVVFLVPNVLYCLALWLMFFRTDTKRRQFPMGGYTLARIMMILKFLIACLVLAVGLVISVYFVVVGAQRKSGSIDSSLIQGVILLVVMIVLSVFVVMYYIQWMFCLKVVRDNAKKGTDPGRMPGFVVVLSFLCTAACVALMIPMAPNDYFGLAARGSAALYFLVSGFWILIYKIRVKRS